MAILKERNVADCESGKALVKEHEEKQRRGKEARGGNGEEADKQRKREGS